MGILSRFRSQRQTRQRKVLVERLNNQCQRQGRAARGAQAKLFPTPPELQLKLFQTPRHQLLKLQVATTRSSRTRSLKAPGASSKGPRVERIEAQLDRR